MTAPGARRALAVSDHGNALMRWTPRARLCLADMPPEHLGPADAPDRFALLRRLGGGNMGVVYEAHDRATGSRIALKTLAHGDARFLTNLKREFRLVQSLIHPNLVRLGGLFQAPTRGSSRWSSSPGAAT